MGEPELGSKAARFEDVLDAERDAHQRAAARRRLRRHLRPRVKNGIHLLDPGEASLNRALALGPRGVQPVNESVYHQS
jgi:hypothetical protein